MAELSTSLRESGTLADTPAGDDLVEPVSSLPAPLIEDLSTSGGGEVATLPDSALQALRAAALSLSTAPCTPLKVAVAESPSALTTVLESATPEMKFSQTPPSREHDLALHDFAQVEALASSAAVACQEARAARGEIEEQGLKHLRTIRSELQDIRDAAGIRVEVLESEVETVACHFVGESEACHDLMQQEAARGRRLLAELSECRRDAEARISPIWARAIKHTELINARVGGGVGESKLLGELAEFRAAARNDVTELEAEAVGAAAACTEARALREVTIRQGLDQSKTLLAEVGKWKHASNSRVANLESEAHQLTIRCEQAKLEQDAMVRKFAERGRLLLAEQSTHRRARGVTERPTPATRKLATRAARVIDIMDDDDMLSLSSEMGQQLLARAAELAQEGLVKGRALLAHFSDSPAGFILTETTVSPEASRLGTASSAMEQAVLLEQDASTHGLPSGDETSVKQQSVSEDGANHSIVQEKEGPSQFSVLRSCIAQLHADVGELRNEMVDRECADRKSVV